MANNISNPYMRSLGQGPLRLVRTFKGFLVNGYRFHIKANDTDRATMNSGVCIKGSNYSITESDYYGILTEIVELEYPALPMKRTVLFKCDWFDPTPNSGTIVHEAYKLVDINYKRRFNKYEPFVLVAQAA